MTARSPVAKVLSLILATSVVAGTVQWGMPRGTIELEGSGTPAEAKMGSRFEDMAVGTLTAMTPDDTLTPMAEPVSVEQVAPVPMAAPVPAPLASVPVTSETAPVPPVEVIAAQSLPDTITAEDPDSDAPALSRRPQRKDSVLATKASEAQEKDARSRRAAAKPADRKPEPSKSARGNADHSNTKGAQTGTRAEAKASQTGRKATPARQAGNAAASNYPGQVMRRIAQVGKPRVNARGTATIAFSITSGGGLAGVSVARSSGSASLDQAAVRLIRQAAPFPRPPAGAQRQFSIRIKGR
tara:strand:+ start:1549 stop:2442 length:894 start_codon:yes stop_codon:yes gene_type:complete